MNLPKHFKTILYLGLAVSAQVATAQQILIQGIVRDKGLSEPIPGARIAIKGSETFTISDAEGQFNLSSDKPFPVYLVVNGVGYQSQEVPVLGVNNSTVEILLVDDLALSEVVITSRRRKETAQDVPIPISVVAGQLLADAGAFNVNRLKEIVPTVQLYSSNPRNTTLNIRGLGSTFGLTNDGIDPGVGFYIDGVYYARPAVTALDFIDVEQIEVLRGPQGTLFGKNTTAGAFNVSSKAPAFTPGVHMELSYGNIGFVQAKTSITGPLGKKLAGRLSFSGTQRDGTLKNIRTQESVNDLNNLGFRAQLLYTPTDRIHLTLIGDATRQRPNGYAQVVAGVATTKRAAYRQFNQIISDLGYSLPTQDPFDRIIDHDTPWRSKNDLGGASINLDAKIGRSTLTATSAWRYWVWGPSNDRDFTGLSVLSLSQAPSKHQQWSQEIRFAGNFNEKLSGVVGVFALWQDLKTDPYHTEESGAAQWRFSQSSTSELWKTPGLLDGYGIRTTSRLESFSGAVFGQLDWAITSKLHLLTGLRYNSDQKSVNFNRQTYGGLQTTDPQLLALKNAVYTNQAFTADVAEGNFSGQVTVAVKPSSRFHAFAKVSNSFKPVGVNLGGLPTANGEILTDLARIKPEYATHFEAGVKTKPSLNATLNLVAHLTDIKDYQTLVQTAEVGVNRGYLANAERVRVWGLELDGNIRINKQISINAALAYTDGKYVSFINAPVPLEETGGQNAFKDISGQKLPGISDWAGSLGGEISTKSGSLIGQKGKYFMGLDVFYRSAFSSSASPSIYLNVDGYALLNARIGFKATEGITVFAWSRNLLNADYFEQLLPAAGNAGHYAGVLGDPRTFGITLRYGFGL
ncbi:MAG: TonB-dependent receptor [Chitinophagales bacterium]|nr:TonB-dependent receptor [Chitinophagales bacterium]